MTKRALIVLTILLGFSALVFAGTDNTIAVIYNGNSKVNRETFMYFSKTQRMLGYNFSYQAISADSDPSGDYAGYIILNTGMTDGVDPVIQSFIERNPGLRHAVMVSLVKDSTDYEVTSVSADSSPLGVDAVSAASAWQEGRGRGGLFGGSSGGSAGGGSTILQMHQTWFKEVLELISA